MIKNFIRSLLVSTLMYYSSALLLSSNSVAAANQVNTRVSLQQLVTGEVHSSTGPLSGITVTVKEDPTVATVTNEKGVFSIRAVKGQTLLFTAVGFHQQEHIVSTENISITLKTNDEILDEVIVVAFGTQKRENLTGAVASISPKQLAERPVNSIQNALQGISPGITVLSRPVEVARGNNATITVRGRSNLGSPSPMYIIDGIPATAVEFGALSPSDINSMSVLKDAASASLYGSRAANGVILVTTKKGGGERPVIGLSANYGWQSTTVQPDYANSLQYIELYNRAMANVGRSTPYTDEIIENYRSGTNPDLYPDTDWYNAILDQGAPQRDVNLNITSPSKYGSYYLGLNYFDQYSIVPGRSQNRFNIKLNSQTDVIKDILKIGTNVSFLKQDFDRDGLGISWVEMGRALPMTVIQQSDGRWGSISNGVTNATIAANNQLRRITEGGEGNDRDNYLQMAGNLSFTPFKGFSIDGLLSLKYTNANSWSFTHTMDPIVDWLTDQPLASTAVTVNEMTEYWRKREELLTQITANYEQHFGDHYGKITAGASQEANVYREAFLGRRNFLSNASETIVNGSSSSADISSDDDGLANRTTQEEWSIRSFFGRFNYVFADKYLFEANARIDYSSRFAPEVRRAVFPSFSAGWNMDKEAFLRNVSWVNTLKLRGSWGVLGNQDAVAIGNYYDLISVSSLYNFEGNAVDGAQQSAAVNRNALWEKVYMSNIGVDAALLNGKINFTVDYYVKSTKDILLQPTLLATYGWSEAAYTNQGETRNKGIEMSATYNGRVGGDFTYSISGNLSKIKNEIISLGTGRSEMISGDYWINRVGGSVGDYYGYQSDGLFTSQEEIDNHPSQTNIAGNSTIGDIKYVDVNGDGILNAEDRTILGNDVPWFNYGVNVRMAYRHIDLEVLTYGVAGVDTYLIQEASFPFFNGANIKSAWLDGWTEENNVANAPFPRITTTTDAPQNYITSDFWLFSGDYFRIRAITLGYTFKPENLQRYHMSNLRLFASSNNPFTFMADKRLADYDPETGSGRAGYPGVKTISVGITARF